MQERELKFNRNEDPTPVVLTEKQAKDYKKASDDLRFGVAHLTKELVDGTLTTGMKETMCSLVESYSQQITKCLGYEGVLHQEKEERHAEIRQLNQENRDLRKQLGEKNSPEDVRESLKNLKESFNAWWNIEGFGHCSDEQFGPYGFKASLSGMITEAYRDKTDPNATEESKVNKLTTMGFAIRPGSSRHERKILYNDDNLQLLSKLLIAKYPSACIHESKAWHGSRNEDSEIREVQIMIRNFDDLFEEVSNG